LSLRDDEREAGSEKQQATAERRRAPLPTPDSRLPTSPVHHDTAWLIVPSMRSAVVMTFEFVS
jgi:hypothetical protein